MGPRHRAFKGSALESIASHGYEPVVRKPQAWSTAKDLNLYTRRRSLLRRVRLPFRQQWIKSLRFVDTSKRRIMLCMRATPCGELGPEPESRTPHATLFRGALYR